MYTQYFNFQAPPFSIAPDPRYLYMSAKHREALAHLLYGVNGGGGGFVALTGEVGTGKTTLCRGFLEQLPDSVDVALIFNPRLSASELLASICDELRIPYPSQRLNLKQLSDALNKHLLAAHAAGRRTVVLIDEAQNLSFDVLEQVRLLTNLETSQAKLLQVILVGQPELKHMLQQANLRQLAQRITARYHLQPLSFEETVAYIKHRLQVSGCRLPVFSWAALAQIHWLSGGVPRLINVICDRALLGAYSQEKPTVNFATVRRAAREVLPRGRRFAMFWQAGLVFCLLIALVGAVAVYRDLAWEWPAVAGLPFAEEPGEAAVPAASTAPSGAMAAPERDAVKAGDAVPVAQAATVEPPAPPPEAFRLAAQLAVQGVDRELVLSRLLDLWGMPGQASGGDACVYAVARGVSCLSSRGSWGELLKLSLPAMLEFSLPGGKPRYALLLGANGSQVELEIGGQAQFFDEADVLSLWRGQYTLLWQPPFAGVTLIKPGQDSAAVAWLRQQLVPEGGATPALIRPTFFDTRLEAQVRAFQAAQDLTPDGVVGAQTMIGLQKRMAAPGIPWLSLRAE